MEFAEAPVLNTRRLRLRGWQHCDLTPFARLNADPQVTEFLPQALTRDESDGYAGRIQEQFSGHGFGRWVVEVADTRQFAGFVGLSVPTFEAAFTPCVEIGWRLAAAYWGLGYATEAARAAVDYAFDTAGLTELVSFTVPENQRSRAVMERLGMQHDPKDDFDHPRLPEQHRLRRHVLYRLSGGQRLGRSE